VFVCMFFLAPKIFPILFNIAKPFLSEATKRKIVILGSECLLRYLLSYL